MLPGGKGFREGVLEAVPEVARLARLHVRAPFALDSSSLAPSHWAELAGILAEERDRHAGFVVTHGTDTMAYTAAALSFMLPGFGKPIILTGAQRPLAEIRTDARSNLVDAVEVATRNLPEVAIVFGGAVLRGNRARKRSLEGYRAFESPNYPLLGEVGTELLLNESAIRRVEDDASFGLVTDHDPHVLHIRLAPGMHGSSLEGLDTRRTRGVVLQAFGAGNVPLREGREAFPLERLRDAGVPVLILGGSEHGTANLRLYEGGRRAADLGAVSARDMTAEAAVVKMMCALGRAKSPDAVRALLSEDWAGEITPEEDAPVA